MTKSKEIDRIKVLIFTFVSGVYAYRLSLLPSFLFRDRVNYLIYAMFSEDRIDRYLYDNAILFKEPLFLYLNKGLSFLENPDLTLQIFVFFISFSVMFFTLKSFKSLFTSCLFFLLIFFHTQFFAIQLVALRQGIGLALLLWFILYNEIFFKKHIYLIFFSFFCGFIHNSFFIVSLMLFVDWSIITLIKEITLKLRLIILVSVSLFISLSVLTISSILETKQDYSDFEYSSGGGAFLLWLSVLGYILMFKSRGHTSQRTIYIYSICLSGLIIYLSSYFFTPIAGRIIGTYIPFIYYIILYRMNIRDMIFAFILLLINLYLFFEGGAEGFLLVPLNSLIYALF